MIPTKSPGTLFSELTGGDTTLNIRWLLNTEPVYAPVFNRPISDVAIRQLVLAKAVDNLQIALGHSNLFPFINQPKVTSSTVEVDLPIGLIWDIQVSLPKKWENLRLAKIKRISGENTTTGGYTGKLRFVFTANIENSSTEVSVLQADYLIDSQLTYQATKLLPVPSTEESVVINPGEVETVAGFILFKTLDTNATSVKALFDLLAPGDTTDSNSDGIFDTPEIYEISDSLPGSNSVTGDISLLSISHGTGLLTSSALSSVPQLDSDIQSWLKSFNYPFDADANRTSVNGIVIPNGLFREFNITAPAGDEPTGDTTGTYYPVWINRIEKIGTGNTLRFFFATYNVTDTAYGGSPSTTAIEFASLDLVRTSMPGDIVDIVPIENLQLAEGLSDFGQHFGRGHVVLSSSWDNTSSDVEDFYSSFDVIATSPPDTEFSKAATRISSFGISRVPKYVPTVGQAQALTGSTSRRKTPVHPSTNNRYITEADQGLGDQVDLESNTSITPNAAIDRYGYSGSLSHKIIKLIIDSTKLGSDTNFYDAQILPRLRILLGRDPSFGDFWYNGTRLMFYNGDTWQG